MNNLSIEEFKAACFYDKLDHVKSLMYILTNSCAIIQNNAELLANKNNLNIIYKELEAHKNIMNEIDNKMSLLFVDEREHIRINNKSRFKVLDKFNFVPNYLKQSDVS